MTDQLIKWNELRRLATANMLPPMESAQAHLKLQYYAPDILAALNASVKREVALRDAANNLLALKEYKEANGDNEYYRQRKPQAWKWLKQALAGEVG